MSTIRLHNLLKIKWFWRTTWRKLYSSPILSMIRSMSVDWRDMVNILSTLCGPRKDCSYENEIINGSYNCYPIPNTANATNDDVMIVLSRMMSENFKINRRSGLIGIISIKRIGIHWVNRDLSTLLSEHAQLKMLTSNSKQKKNKEKYTSFFSYMESFVSINI